VATKIGLGGFPGFLIQNLCSTSPVELAAVPSMSAMLTMNRKELTKTLEELNDFQYVVYRLSGENPLEFIRALRLNRLLGQFKNRKYSVSFWTMDSHHLGKFEATASRFFDHVFVAHKPYLKLFEERKASYLPCSFSLTDEQNVERYLSESEFVQSGNSICAAFAAYPWEKRNRSYLHAMEATEALDYSESFFGTIRGGERINEGLIRKMLAHKATLNFSLSDDLNMRNFEALALNRILITNKVEDHELFSDFRDNIVFVNPEAESIRESIREALMKKPKDISEKFLGKHSLRARLLSIIESLTGLLLQPNQIYNQVQFARAKNQGVKESNQPVEESRHSKILLLAKSGWPKWNDAQILKRSGQRFPSFLRGYLFTWLGGLTYRAFVLSAGRSATLRALRSTLCRRH
jgi:hypothetical protein